MDNDKGHQQRQMRRRLLAASVALAAMPWAGAQTAAGAQAGPLRNVGVFSLLGDGVEIAAVQEVTDSRLDRSRRESFTTRDIGLDNAALRAVTKVFESQQPAARLHMYRANSRMAPSEQRALADGATRAELPAWIVSAIHKDQLSHILLITRNRGEASFPVTGGFVIGRGTVDGIGFYLDTATELKNLSTGMSSRGYLGAYVELRLQLIDVQSGDVVATRDVRAGQAFAGRTEAENANIWDALDGREKVNVLRNMVQDNVARVMPELLAGR